MFSKKVLTRGTSRSTIHNDPNARDERAVVLGRRDHRTPLNEGGGGIESAALSVSHNLTHEELPNWIAVTRAQGEPSNYRKEDLEIWVCRRLFDRFRHFRGGDSQRERRKSFEELWELCVGVPQAIAYGFEAALRARVYSVDYVKACIKNFVKASSTPPTLRREELRPHLPENTSFQTLYKGQAPNSRSGTVTTPKTKQPVVKPPKTRTGRKKQVEPEPDIELKF